MLDDVLAGLYALFTLQALASVAERY
jgi:phosphatidylglycerophosphatase A